MSHLAEGFAAGYARLIGQADLLDQINVFPVADADTGANLRISLEPLRQCGQDRTATAARLVRSATGNSGNIAAAFFSWMVLAQTPAELPVRASQGRDLAWRAVATPQAGTMLDVFDTLVTGLAAIRPGQDDYTALLADLAVAVAGTAQTLPDLRRAGVVDAGALGMFLIFEGLFQHLGGCPPGPQSLFARFSGRLTLAADYCPVVSTAHCIDATLRPSPGCSPDPATFATLGGSVVVLADNDRLKIHVHSDNPTKLRARLERLGEVMAWSEDAIVVDGPKADPSPTETAHLHLMTDAAGSLSRSLARQHGITLLDSYVVTTDGARPETLCDPEVIYQRLRRGERVTTAQASLAERQALYQGVCERFGPTLYLTVGSAYTGNYATALAWKKDHDHENRLMILDTGAASGRLALIALLTARFARKADSVPAIIARARQLSEQCREYVFLDTLRYLAASGRIAKSSGFVGDLFHLKPVITPTPEGARRVGMVRSHAAQLTFLRKRITVELDLDRPGMLLLQHADNRERVEGEILPHLRTMLPKAEILLTPLSLTSGVHMGPGAWSLAFAQED